MKKPKSKIGVGGSLKLTFVLCMNTLVASSVMAQNWISWVASNGNNSNPCTRALPCADFARAVSVTNAYGIVKAVDAADYGQLYIDRPITIDGNGVAAATTTFLHAPVISVNPPISGSESAPAFAEVTIRNLTINTASSFFQVGILVQDANTHIENVVITGNPSPGVLVDNVNSNGVPLVSVKNLTVVGVDGRDNPGFMVQGGSVTIRDSVFRGGGVLIQGSSFTKHFGTAWIEHSEISFSNGTGLSVGGLDIRAVAHISDCVVTGNAMGILAKGGGQIISFGTNILTGNTVDGATTGSASLK
jgi:hypothetical protein